MISVSSMVNYARSFLNPHIPEPGNVKSPKESLACKAAELIQLVQLHAGKSPIAAVALQKIQEAVMWAHAGVDELSAALPSQAQPSTNRDGSLQSAPPSATSAPLAGAKAVLALVFLLCLASAAEACGRHGRRHHGGQAGGCGGGSSYVQFAGCGGCESGYQPAMVVPSSTAPPVGMVPPSEVSYRLVPWRSWDGRIAYGWVASR